MRTASRLLLAAMTVVMVCSATTGEAFAITRQDSASSALPTAAPAPVIEENLPVEPAAAATLASEVPTLAPFDTTPNLFKSAPRPGSNGKDPVSHLPQASGGSGTEPGDGSPSQDPAAEPAMPTGHEASLAPDVVGYSIHGTVTDVHGTPTPGNQVEVFLYTGSTYYVAVAYSGSYSITVPTGTYRLYFKDQNAINLLYETGWYSAGGMVYASALATPVVVSTGDVQVDMVMPTLLYIRGTLTFPETSIGNYCGSQMKLYAYRGGYSYTRYVDYVTSSQADGTFAIPVEPGTYELFFTYILQSGTCTPGWYANGGIASRASGASEIHVISSDATGINVTFQTIHAVQGKVTSASGAALANVYVEAYVNGGYVTNATTSSAGLYSFGGLPQGKATFWLYDLTGARAGGWYTKTGPTANPNSAYVLTSTGLVTGLNIVLPAGARIHGVVSGSNAGGLANVVVVAHAFGDSSSLAGLSPDGSFSMPVLPGTYTVEVYDSTGTIYASGWYKTGSGFTLDPAGATPVTVAGTATATIGISLPLVTHIQGTITDANGFAIPGVVSESFSNGYFYSYSVSDASGNYSLDVPPGTYRVGFYDTSLAYASGWYTASGLVSRYGDADDLAVSGSNLTGANIHLLPMSRPNQPTDVSGVPYNQSVVVSWSPPLFDGGHAITGYAVTASPDGATCTTTGATSCTVSGLDNGTPYTFTVTATNSLGTSDPSDASDPVIPIAVPDAPVVTAAPGIASVLVGWTTPADNGSAITGYAVTSTPPSAGCSGGASASSCTVSGLTNGVAYTFSVVASNGNGPGPAGLSSPVAPQPVMTRYAGPDNFATAAAVSANTWPSPCHCTAYIAYGYNFPDALAGAAAAGSVHGPVLFVATTGAINAYTAAELTRLQPDHIVALGSAGVISDAVFAALSAYAPAGQTFRYYGPDRFGTAAAVSANTFGANCGCTVYVAFAMNFPDALAGAAAAGTVPGPVLLVATTGAINLNTRNELLRLKPNHIIVLGSTGVVSAAVFNSLVPYAPPGATLRYWGADRYATAASISSHTFSANCGCVVYISAGTDFNGALAAAAAAGTIKGPLLLVAATGNLPASTATELLRLKPARIVVVGGGISASVYNLLAAYAPTS